MKPHYALRFPNGWWTPLLVLVLTAPATAHNGALAIAVPVEGITVDGDFSDWPAEMKRYPIALPAWGAMPQNAEDYSGGFRVAYNSKENALYLAVEMHDESVVVDTSTTAAFNAHDACEVYLDAWHDSSDTAPVGQYFMRDVPGAYGSGVSLTDFAIAVQREQHVYRFEWRIDIGKRTQGQMHLRPGMSLGFAVALCDRDADSTFTWVGEGPGDKFTSSGLGDLLLVDERVPLEGHVRWADSQEGIAHAEIQVRSGAMRVEVAADANGNFAVDLPPGRYQIKLNWPGRASHPQQVDLRATHGSRVEFAVPASKGQQVAVGPGRGQWKTFGMAEGLPNQLISAVYQDRAGNLWFGTDGGGVAYYDGRTITAFTTRDGLADNSVTAILEDRQGHMWFTTYQGVSCYARGKFTSFGARNGFPGVWCSGIAEDRHGALWISSANGLSVFDGERFANLTTKDGLADNMAAAVFEDREGTIWIGTGVGLSRYDGKSFRTLTTKDGLASNTIGSIAQDHSGNLWLGTRGGGVSRFDGQRFSTFTTQNGLAHNDVYTILVDREGTLWFGTFGGGVSRYDGSEIRTFTEKDGLAGNIVTSIREDQEGNLWFGTYGGGVSQYQGEQFRTFRTADGLLDDHVASMVEDRQGALWFGMDQVGLYTINTLIGASRFDGRTFTNFGTADGLRASDILFADLLQDRAGNLWFGPVRYDGRHFRIYTGADGMVPGVAHLSEDRQGNVWAGGATGVVRYENDRFVPFDESFDLGVSLSLGMGGVSSVVEDRRGNIWVGTVSGGVFRYDGAQTRLFTSADGLGGNGVLSFFEDQQGHIWVGSVGSGVSRFDGQGFQTWSMKDGLAGNQVYSILQDHEGRLLFSSFGGGLSLFDGRVFQNLTTQDGLADNRVTDLLQDRHGDIWISTLGGVTCYRPYRTPPPIQITEVTADHRYGPISAISLSTSQDYLAFEFQGRSLKTRPGQMAYVYRLQGYDGDWRVTREERVVYADLPRGDYTFEVKAVDRDLTYSETPATVQVQLHLPYRQLFLYGLLAVALVGLGLTSGMAMRRRRALLREQQARLQAQEQLNRELEDELQTAHDLQMGLMPKSPPHIPGLDIAGQCIPANHVGGDFFQYFQQEGTLSLCLADVTGHAMEAAVPGLMFSGVLKSQVELGEPLDLLFQRLNRTLHSTLDARTFVCFTMGQYDPATGIFRLADAGCPYPYHYRAATGTIEELQVEAYPLGVRAEGRYPVLQTTLAPGDRVVFCSDGVIEATNGAGEMFGFERTSQVILAGCAQNLPADQLLERILAEVKAFRGAAAQGDDQTVVVMRLTD